MHISEKRIGDQLEYYKERSEMNTINLKIDDNIIFIKNFMYSPFSHVSPFFFRRFILGVNFYNTTQIDKMNIYYIEDILNFWNINWSNIVGELIQ